MDLKNDLAETEELSADLMRDYGDSVDETQKAQDFYNTILQTGNKALIEKAKASWDTAAATEQAKKNAMDENKERKEASAQAIEYFEKAQIDKQVAEKRVELQEGMNELFGVSIKDVEKYGKKFQQFVNKSLPLLASTPTVRSTTVLVVGSEAMSSNFCRKSTE